MSASAYTLAKDEADRTSVTAAAVRIGVSRTALSLYLRGVYPAGTAGIEARIERRLGHIVCPFLDQTLTPEECRRYAGRPASAAQTSRAIAHWRACDDCAKNPNHEPQEEAENS